MSKKVLCKRSSDSRAKMIITVVETAMTLIKESGRMWATLAWVDAKQTFPLEFALL